MVLVTLLFTHNRNNKDRVPSHILLGFTSFDSSQELMSDLRDFKIKKEFLLVLIYMYVYELTTHSMKRSSARTHHKCLCTEENVQNEVYEI